VVEEVVVGKEVSEHTENVSDGEVDVEQFGDAGTWPLAPALARRRANSTPTMKVTGKLRACGRFVFDVWDQIENNEFCYVLTKANARLPGQPTHPARANAIRIFRYRSNP
jgi:hypothetical protein